MANLVNDGQYFENCELSTEPHFSVCEYGCNCRSLGELCSPGQTGRLPLRIQKLAPAVDKLPPHEAKPLVEIYFRPLTMSPPKGSELSRVVGCGHVECEIGSLFMEFAQRASCVKVGSYD